MIITLFNNVAENTRVDKSLYLESIASVDCVFKMNTSVISPTIIIDERTSGIMFVYADGSPVTANGSQVSYGTALTYQDFIKTNYIYIPDLKRYYYVNDITSISNKLWQFNCTCDVLNTYKNDIINLSGFVTRNEFKFDNYIKDDLVSFKYDKYIGEFTPVSGNKVNLTFNTNTNVTDTNYTIAVVNDEISASFDVVNSPTSILPDVSAHNSGMTSNCCVYTSYHTSVSTMFKNLVGDTTDLADGLLSVVAWPFIVPRSNVVQHLKIKSTTMDNVNVYPLQNKLSQYFVVADFKLTKRNFLQYEPYTTYQLYLPYVSWIDISADELLDNRILVIYTLNYQNGTAQVSVINDTLGHLIYTSTTQLGVVIPVSSTNQQDVERNKLSNNIGLGIGLLSSGATIVGGAMTGNPLAVFGGVMATGKNIASYIQNANSNILHASGSVASGVGGVYLPQKVRLRVTEMRTRGYDNNFIKLHGKPLNQYIQLGELTGYTQVGNIHVENISGATTQELNSIENYLLNGVIL